MVIRTFVVKSFGHLWYYVLGQLRVTWTFVVVTGLYDDVISQGPKLRGDSPNELSSLCE